MKQIKRWELLGIVFITVLGTLLHFAFEWTGYWKPAAVVAAVNESVWEHLKIAFWPALAYVLAEYFICGRKMNNFLEAKALELILIPLSIVALFYSYTAILGKHILALDIAIFILAIIIGQLSSLKLLSARKLPIHMHLPSVIVILILIAAFSTLTFYPPEFALFKDPQGGSYGITSTKH